MTSERTKSKILSVTQLTLKIISTKLPFDYFLSNWCTKALHGALAISHHILDPYCYLVIHVFASVIFS